MFNLVVFQMILCQGATWNTDSVLMAGTAAPWLLTVRQTCDFVYFSFDFSIEVGLVLESKDLGAPARRLPRASCVACHWCAVNVGHAVRGQSQNW